MYKLTRGKTSHVIAFKPEPVSSSSVAERIRNDAAKRRTDYSLGHRTLGDPSREEVHIVWVAIDLLEHAQHSFIANFRFEIVESSSSLKTTKLSVLVVA